MAQPVVYNWFSSLSPGFRNMTAGKDINGNYPPMVLNQPLVLNEFSSLSYVPPDAQISSGNVLKGYSNVQQISIVIRVTAGLGSYVFSLTGLDAFGQVQSENVTVKVTALNANTTGISSFYYSQILSIIPIQEPVLAIGATLRFVGVNTTAPLGGGYTKSFLCDVWNKQALYSYAITNVFLSTNNSPLTITLTLGGTGSSITTSPVFTITGVTSQGQTVTETVGNFTANLLSQNTNYAYMSVSSISITTAAVLGGTTPTLKGAITIAQGGAQISQSSSFDTTVDGNIPLQTATLSVTPQYTLDQFPQWKAQGLSGQQPLYIPTWTSMNADNIPSSSTSPFVIPITSSSAASFPNFPITGLRFLVNSTNTASFTATILQQGGYY